MKRKRDKEVQRHKHDAPGTGSPLTEPVLLLPLPRAFYEPSAERNRQRSTGAHSTVEVNGLDSSEVWGGFRVGRRARPREVRWGGESPAVN